LIARRRRITIDSIRQLSRGMAASATMELPEKKKSPHLIKTDAHTTGANLSNVITSGFTYSFPNRCT
jgi:hypothetical protein